MKTKLFLLPLVFLFTSCSTIGIQNITFQNNSSSSITFEITNISEKPSYTIPAGESLKLKLYPNPRISFSSDNRIEMKRSYNNFYFIDSTPYTFHIINTSFYNVTLTEKNNMLGKVKGESAIIPSATISTDYNVTYGESDVTVYTETPDFQAYFTNNDKQYNAMSLLIISEN